MNLSYLYLGPMVRLMGAPGGGDGSSGSSMLSFLPLVLIIGIFYFLILRPQNKKQKETQKMLSALKKGDRIITAGGLHGIIQSVKESTVIVKVDENVKLEFSRSSISSVSSQAREEKEEKIEAPRDEKGESEAE